MRLFFVIFSFLFVAGYSSAQDTAVLISPSMFTSNKEILIAPLDGWLFKEGDSTTWANGNTDLTGWKKFKPTELSVLKGYKNGRVEVWFRMKIKLDDSFKNMPLGFKYTGWAATEIYLDGKMVESYGNTGSNGKPFNEYNPIHRYAVPLHLEHGKEYLFAIHFVDYISGFPLPGKIKSATFPLPYKRKPGEYFNLLFSITGPTYNTDFERRMYSYLVFKTSIAAVCFIMTLLFWLMSFQNAGEINLRLITIFSLVGTLYSFLRLFWLSQSCTYNMYMVTQFLNGILSLALFGLIPLIVAQTLEQKKSFYLKFFFALTILTGIFWGVYSNLFLVFPALVISIVSMLISCYLIFRSWRSIRGAQWAIIVGFFLLLFFSVILTVIVNTASFTIYLILDSLIFIALPFAYVVYVSKRFREILNEVKENALQLIRVSAEKKELVDRQNEILEAQVNERTGELNQSLLNLKATQKQLIQSEKMASLGELTAGIAHEIQNPLNFVNNFSEVNTELIDEARQEIDKGNIEEAKIILNDIKENEQKINHHGKRADGIVKGMLQHSRSSSGQKEPTDINALVDEYLRLAYHGLRAKDKSFNATMVTDFDPAIGKVNVLPQDIGRVILNLITNAFYAVSDKKKNTSKPPEGEVVYEPTVTISTKLLTPPSGGRGAEGYKVTISVKDNGNGVSQKVMDKIFQPFFTTKPTGEGTGLGLSMSYDIVTKGHGGTINFETAEGKFTEFIIILPIV
jgi:two-component system NtrC family sensor kinase